MSHELTMRLDRERTMCGELLARITHAEVSAYAIPGFLHGSAISRGRGGDAQNSIFRAVVQLYAMRIAGDSRQDAMAIVAKLQCTIEQLWPSAGLDLRDAIARAQASDCSEDMCETRALLDPMRMDRWADSIELHIADAIVLVAAIRSRTAELKRAA